MVPYTDYAISFPLKLQFPLAKTQSFDVGVVSLRSGVSPLGYLSGTPFEYGCHPHLFLLLHT